jgi:hypothetical protein
MKHWSKGFFCLLPAGAIQTGAMAMNGLASLGDAALDPVISITREKTSTRVVAGLVNTKEDARTRKPESFQGSSHDEGEDKNSM